MDASASGRSGWVRASTTPRSAPSARVEPVRGLLLLIAATTAASCRSGVEAQQDRPAGAPSPELRVLAIEAPTPAGLYPAFAQTADGSTLLIWTEEVGTAPEPSHRLSSAVWDGIEFGPPRTLAQGAGWFVNWADFPTAARDGQGELIFSWLERFHDRPDAYGARVAVASAHSEQVSPAVDLMSDASGPEYGFVSLVPTPGGGARALWLDGRNAHGHHEGAMSLRTRAIGPDGSLGAEVVLDERVCDCCNTAAVRVGDDRLLVAYRDRDEQEVRDISLLRGRLGSPVEWSEPQTVRADGWRIEGCPVNGPALAAAGERVALAWFTAADGSSEVWVSLSEDGGENFEDAWRVDQGQPIGRVDLAFLAEEILIVSWLEYEGEASTWRVRELRAGADELEIGEPLSVASVSGDRADGFLRMTRCGEAVLAAWTDGRTSELRLVRLERAPVSQR